MVQLLLAAGADPKAKNGQVQYAFDVELPTSDEDATECRRIVQEAFHAQ